VSLFSRESASPEEVHLRGQVYLQSTKEILVRMVDQVDGVVGVVDELAGAASRLAVPVPEGLD
jgi:hypothetical protein